MKTAISRCAVAMVLVIAGLAFSTSLSAAATLTLACANGTAEVGIAYSSALVPSGGAGPYTFSIVSGGLPPGLTLDPSTGAITGTPTTAATFNYTAKVVDAAGVPATVKCHIKVAPSLESNCPPKVVVGFVGQPYTNKFVVHGGVAPFTFAIISGSLPPGLTLNMSTGVVSGTPTTAGTFIFAAQVTDSLGAVYNVNVGHCVLIIKPPTITLACASSTGQVGVAYSSALVVTGGTAPYTFSISSGSLPPGLTLNTTTGAITGTPTTAGTFNFTAKVVDSTGTAAGTKTADCSIVIAPPPVTLACASSSGQVGVAYSSALVAGGGVPPYTFSISSGSLPPGLTLNPSTGAITGTPTTAGTFNSTAKVVDSTGTAAGTKTADCSIVISPPAVTLACASSTGQVGVAYSSALVAGGGVPPYTFSISSGSLPPGLTLNPSTGAITGTPTTPGTFNFTAKVVDSTNTAAGTKTADCSIVIAPPPVTLACASSTGQVGVPYSSALVAGGGIPPYTFSISSGSLPPGLTLNPSTGAITGTPTTPGTFNFTAKVVDSTNTVAGTKTADCSIVIAPPPVTLACASSTGQVGVPYSSALVAGGGIPPYTFSISSGSLPPGLTLDPSTGAITGTPTTPGTFNFTAKVVDSTNTAAGTKTADCSIVIAPPPVTLACASSTGQVGVPYSSALVAGGGIPPYTFSISSGSLPPGLTLDPSTGAITGTPTTPGTFNFTAKVVDSTNTAAGTKTADCSIVIAPPPVTLACASSTGQVGVAYSSALVAGGGIPPYTFSIISGSLPPGLTLDTSSGAITGTPTTPGTFNFTAQVVDSTNSVAGTKTADCSITVVAPSLTITKVADAGGTPSTVAAVGQPIGFTVVVTSGGPADATNVTLSDPLPNPNGASSGVNWSIDSTTGGPTCSITGSAPSQTLNCSEAILAVGASFSVHVTSATSIPSAALYTNCAVASATGVSPVQACAPITVVGACTLNYPFGTPPALTSVVFTESEDLVAAAACNAGGCGEPVAGPTDWVALWYTDERAQTLGVRQVAVKTASGTTTTNYPITALSTNPGSAINPQVGTTVLGDNLFFPNPSSPTPQGLPNIQAGTDVATWNATYFFLDSGRPLWPALFATDITSNPNATSGDYQQGGMTAVPPSDIYGTWKGAVRTVDTTKSPYAITVTPDKDPAKNMWNLGPGSDTPPGGFGLYPSLGFGTEDRWNVSSILVDGKPLSPGHAYRLQIMVHDGDQNKSGGDVGEACLNVVIPGVPGNTPPELMCPAPTAAPNTSYSSAFGVSGGTPPYTFSIASGALPSGLTLDPATGAVTGTPTTTGTFTFTGQVTDSSNPPLTATSPGCAITVTPPPTLLLTKSASPTNVAPFQLVTYTYTVTNNGGSTLTNIVVTDDNGTPSDPTDDFTVGTIASLGPGASATLTWVGYPSYQTVIIDSKQGTIPGGTLAIENVLDGSCTPNVNCNLKFIFNQSLNLNDNSYGTNSSSGWTAIGKIHKFQDLTGSDQAWWQFFDSKGNQVLFFSEDYISAATAPAASCPNASWATYPSGYGTLGWCGGDGKFFSGDATKIVSENSTLTDNLNQSPAFYGFTTNSPPAGFPGWNFVDGYSVIIDPAVFGANGFGSVKIPLVHNSPSMNGTDQVCDSPGSSVSTNTATAAAGNGGPAATATASVTITSTIPPCAGGK